MISRRRRLKNSDRPNATFNPNKRIENAYTQCGQIANPTERQNDRTTRLIRISALKMLILRTVGLQNCD